MSAIQIEKSTESSEQHSSPKQRRSSNELSPTEDDDEIQAIIRNPKSGKETVNNASSTLNNYDGHPTKLLRDCYCTNIKSLLYAAGFNIALIFMYLNSEIFLIDFGTLWISIIVNVVWILLREKEQTHKFLDHHAVWTIYIIFQVCFAGLFLFSTVFYIWTTITFDYKPSEYEQADMWLVTSTFLAIVSALNCLYSISFTRHVYHYR